MSLTVSRKDPFARYVESYIEPRNQLLRLANEVDEKIKALAATVFTALKQEDTTIAYNLLFHTPTVSERALYAGATFFQSALYKRFIDYFQNIPTQPSFRRNQQPPVRDVRLDLLDIVKRRYTSLPSPSFPNSPPGGASSSHSSTPSFHDQLIPISELNTFSTLSDEDKIAFFQRMETSISAFFSQRPPSVGSLEELHNDEILRMREMYVMGEPHFQTDESRKEYRKGLVSLAKKRVFFIPQEPASTIVTSSLSTKEQKILDILKWLNKTPALKEKFQLLWNDVRGMEDLKIEMFINVMLPWEAQDVAIESCNGIILYGPPGSGKTYFAETLMKAMGRPIIRFSAATEESKYIHQVATNIQKTFDKARAEKPSCIFIDEITALFPPREQLRCDTNLHSTEDIDCFLRNMNGLGRERILMICTTNLFDKIDPAIKRPGRLDRCFKFSPLDELGRKEVFQKASENKPLSPDVDFEECGRLTEGFTPADITALIEDANRCRYLARKPISQALLRDKIQEWRQKIVGRR